MTNRRLEILKPNRAGCLVPKGSDRAINYGVLKIEDGVLTYLDFAGMKACRENPELIGKEDKLKELGHVKNLPLDDIEYVLF